MNEKELSEAGLEFLEADLHIALTLLDVAATTRDGETARRNRAKARHAYDTALRHLQNFRPDLAQGQVIYQKLGLLKARLQRIGEQF